MKKLTGIFSIVMILAVMAAIVPSGSAFAAKDPGSIILNIHNLSGGNVALNMVDPQGNHHVYNLPKGLTTLSMGQGWYDYFASLPCGNRSGNVQMNVSKHMYLSCGEGVDMMVTNTSGRFIAPEEIQYCYDVYDYYLLEGKNQDLLKTSVCQDTPAIEGDPIIYENPDAFFFDDRIAFFDTDFYSICLPDQGSAYYGLGYYTKNILKFRGKCR